MSPESSVPNPLESWCKQDGDARTARTDNWSNSGPQGMFAVLLVLTALSEQLIKLAFLDIEGKRLH